MAAQKIHFTFLLGVLLFSSCTEKKKTIPPSLAETEKSQQVISLEFQSILDSAKVKGAIVIYDLHKNTYHSNNFDWAKTQRLPASTFKIPNSIIALETGVVKNDSTIFKWNGEQRGMKVWEQDLTFKDAFHFSCVPCYQEVARKIGLKRMRENLAKLDYGTMEVDSTNIAVFWLQGASRISPLEQIEFLKRFYKSNLPISGRTEKIMKRMMVIDKNKEYTLSGKTGLVVQGDERNGWFVGFVETSGRTYFFATNITSSNGLNTQQFITARTEVTMSALRQIGILK